MKGKSKVKKTEIVITAQSRAVTPLRQTEKTRVMSPSRQIDFRGDGIRGPAVIDTVTNQKSACDPSSPCDPALILYEKSLIFPGFKKIQAFEGIDPDPFNTG